MLTEEEAKTKWCPLVRYVVDAPIYPVSAGNRFTGGGQTAMLAEANCRCIGSACMAWRWANQTQAPDGSFNVHERHRGRCNGFRSEARVGFCGAFGEPG